MSDLLWPFLLLLIGLGLMCLELFIPSGGLLAVLTAAAFISSVIMAFYSSGPVAGTGFLAVIVVTVPLLLSAAVRWWPETPLGRLILIQRPKHPDDVLPKGEGYDDLEQLVGRRGVAKSALLPSGAITVEGRTYNAVSESKAIEQGQSIKIVAIRGRRIVVRTAAGEPAATEADEGLPSHEQDLLSGPAEKGIEDPFQEPLT